MKIRPDVRSALAASRADETRLKIGQSNVIQPEIGAHPGRLNRHRLNGRTEHSNGGHVFRAPHGGVLRAGDIINKRVNFHVRLSVDYWPIWQFSRWIISWSPLGNSAFNGMRNSNVVLDGPIKSNTTANG